MSSTKSPIRVVGIAGSLRAQSFNRALLRAAGELLPDGMALSIFDQLGAIPLYNADVEAKGDPTPVVAFKTAIREADALLVATPEYNYGIPGVLKNAIDWASRPPSSSVLQGKPIALCGATPGGTGTARAQLSLRQTFVFTQSCVLPGPELLVARAQDKFDSNGKLTDASTRDHLQKLLERLLHWTRQLGQ